MEPALKQGIWIDKTTNRPPVPGKTDDLELQEHIILSDPVQDNYCLTCPKDVNEEGKVVEPSYTVNIYPPQED